MRRAAKVDSNQTEIVNALRSLGASVQPIHMVGNGVPDILVAFRGKWFVVEIKDGSKPSSKQKLTPAEEEWHQLFGSRATVHIWRSVEEAINCLLTTS